MHAGDKKNHHQMDHTYPDMNNIFFKSVPKMIQIADDMHRMTDYIMDLRNMTIGLVCFSFIGAMIFLFLRHIKKRNGADMCERMIMADHPEDLGKFIQSSSDTYRSYSDPSSTIILAKEFSGKTKSTALMMKADGCAKNTRFANNRNHNNKSPLKGTQTRTNKYQCKLVK
ncbi:hypothetical protein X798_02648 [Onchocerca flexuosa]|uniref:Zinc finger, CCHC-type n=2 Tax=Onchocerca flexuosa TaxID=387005 RepID=A0A183H2P9_9BILA|nr:hypothetical protein X798_02648 [Onchocerca flexuosa]VDO30683.1 unnamed protein product [Onchocerca flexuosa]